MVIVALGTAAAEGSRTWPRKPSAPEKARKQPGLNKSFQFLSSELTTNRLRDASLTAHIEAPAAERHIRTAGTPQNGLHAGQKRDGCHLARGRSQGARNHDRLSGLEIRQRNVRAPINNLLNIHAAWPHSSGTAGAARTTRAFHLTAAPALGAAMNPHCNHLRHQIGR